MTDQQYQLCPKCLGQKTVSRPPMLPADILSWSFPQTSWPCDICNDAGILPLPSVQEEDKKKHAIEFAEFLLKHNMRPNGFGGWGGGDIDINYYGSTSEQIYDNLFNTKP